MENQKFQTLINAEEEHLSHLSTTTATEKKKIVKKSSKTKSISEEKVEHIVIESGISSETEQKSGLIPTRAGEPKPEIELNKKKVKKVKKCEYDNQHISVKSSFNKFNALQKRNLIHVRSSDTGKAQEIFSSSQDDRTNCQLCDKPVYKMEEVKADKAIYHKNCFRCYECAKPLKCENYQNHEGKLYCMLHFKSLLTPKVIEESVSKPRRAELIIRESQPIELPPDVVRASDKPDLGLEELQELNVRSRFQVFENAGQRRIEEEQQLQKNRQTAAVKHSTSILLKLAKLQQNGLNSSSEVGVDQQAATFESPSDDEESSQSDNEMNSEDLSLVRSKKYSQKENPVGLGEAMNDIKKRFENGHMLSKEERREERRQEIQNIRSRLFMGKQAKIKEQYQQAVAETEQGITSVGKKTDVEIGDAARAIKAKFESGAIFQEKDSKNAGQSDVDGIGSIRPLNEKWMKFESSVPSVDDSDASLEAKTKFSDNVLQKTQTTSTMLNIFREMEQNKRNGVNDLQDQGPKPLKRFTPPPDDGRHYYDSVNSEEEEASDDIASDDNDSKVEDDIIEQYEKISATDSDLKEVQAAARAKQLRAKFEKWQANEIQREINEDRINVYDDHDCSTIESTKTIRERFENMKSFEKQTPRSPRYQVKRFV